MMKIFASLGRSGIARLYTFRKEVALLWAAFRDPATPLYLKAAMVGTVLYLVSPIDLLPDFIPLLGIVDDFVIVPLMVGWIVSQLEGHIQRNAGGNRYDPGQGGGKTVDGTARRV